MSHDLHLWERLRAAWSAAGVTIRPGATPAAIEAFEAKYDVLLPGDVRGYFQTVDGMEEEMESFFNRFWPLDLVKPVSEALPQNSRDRLLYPDCFVFLDGCISAYLWCVRMSRRHRAASGEVYLLEIGSESPVAHSFTEFIQMYLKDPMSIL